MRLKVDSHVNIRIDRHESIKSIKKRLQNIMEVAAIKALEAAVERVPAAGETKYSSGQLRQSIKH